MLFDLQEQWQRREVRPRAPHYTLTMAAYRDYLPWLLTTAAYYGCLLLYDCLLLYGSTNYNYGQMSNFEYLMKLNHLAGRTHSDLNQYPVSPVGL